MRLSQEGNPDFKSPPAGCDCHFHVFGPAGRYPHNQADLRYAPPVAPVEDFLALARKLAGKGHAAKMLSALCAFCRPG